MLSQKVFISSRNTPQLFAVLEGIGGFLGIIAGIVEYLVVPFSS
jgi:hypothetical protein